MPVLTFLRSDWERDVPVLRTYAEFLVRLEQLGFMALSKHPAGLPSLGEETAAESWHTGDVETDPWQWKDRAAQEKQAAYGCILNGQKGFVTARMYAYFYAAYHPAQTLADRYAAGELKQTTLQVWQLLEQAGMRSTSELRRAMGVNPGRGAGRLDASIQDLQREFYIAIAGNRRKLAKDGQPYGWPNNVFETVPRWAPSEWLDGVWRIPRREAAAVILDEGLAQREGLSADVLQRELGLP
jgi:hypothetical protein